MKVAQPETRTTRPGWLLLLVILAVLLMSLWFREGDTGPLHRVRVATQSVAAPISSAGMWVSSPFRQFTAWVSDLGVSRSELEELRTQNEELRARVAALEEARLENERLNELLANAMAAGQTGVTGTVIGLPPNAWSQVITIGVGSRSGVGIDMPVVGPNGLVGLTIEVGPTYSRVRLISDQNSGVAALIQRDRILGVAKGSPSGEITLDFVDGSEKVLPGDVVLTSGRGGLFPRGLLIGQVTGVSNPANALYQSIKIRPANDIAATEEVMVLTSAAPSTDNLGGDE